MRISAYGKGVTFTTNTGANNENLTYDKNGNIATLTRYRKGAGQIDNFNYTLQNGNGSNTLDMIDDAIVGDYGFSKHLEAANLCLRRQR